MNISYYVNYVRHSGRDHEVGALDVSRTRKERNDGAKRSVFHNKIGLYIVDNFKYSCS